MSKKTSNKGSPIHELAVEGDDVHGLPQRVQDPDVVPVGESGAAHALQEPRRRRRRRRLRERGAPLLRGQRRRPPRPPRSGTILDISRLSSAWPSSSSRIFFTSSAASIAASTLRSHHQLDRMETPFSQKWRLFLPISWIFLPMIQEHTKFGAFFFFFCLPPS